MVRNIANLGVLVLMAALTTMNATSYGAAPYPDSPVLKGINLDWSTHRREAQGSDNFQLTWADDDHLYGAWGDGGGFGGSNSDGRVGLGYCRIQGDWNNYQGYNVWGGRSPESSAEFAGKSWGTICVDGVLYSWVVPDDPDTGGARDHYRYIQLARSTDKGRHWTRSSWRWSIEDNLIIPTFLNFGRNNAGARDEYVYSYFIRPQSVTITQSSHDLAVHKPGALYLARVHRDDIWSGRNAYSWFTGMNGGSPQWGTIADKQPVFQDPNGVGWCMSASYNAGLQRYILATEHSKSMDGQLGIFDAPEPWGPWTTVAYWSATDRFGASRPGSSLPWRHNIFFLAFPTKWQSRDGKTFTMNFTGGGGGYDNDSFNTVRGTFVMNTPDPTGPMVGHWKFDERSGTTVTDASQAGNTCTLLNGGTWTGGRIDGGLQLDGSGDHVRVMDSTSLDITGNLTLAAWVNFDVLSSTPQNSRNPRIIQKGNSHTSMAYWLAVDTLDPRHLRVAWVDVLIGGVHYAVHGATELNTGTWYHLAGVRDGAQLKVYVNGKLDGSNMIASGPITANSEALFLGESPANSDGNVDGVIDEVRIYKKALSAAEIEALAGGLP